MQIPKVPLIDLKGSEVQILNQLQEACLSSGFFVLKNHGIPSELRATVLANCKQFFDLPEERKLQYKSETMYVVRPLIPASLAANRPQTLFNSRSQETEF